VSNFVRLRHPQGLSLDLSTRGATWLSCTMPMPDGSRRSLILDRPTSPDEEADRAFFGATIGRYANRIGGARIRRGDHDVALTPNPGSRHQLHGGPGGFHTREWSVATVDDTSVRFTLVSRDGDQGYPGELAVSVTYCLSDATTIEMQTEARSTAPCPVCITNHAYFQLDAGPGDARANRLAIAAQHYLPVDAELIPLGPLADVQGTGFDFREAKTLHQDWLRDEQQAHGNGYDHAFLLDAACAGMGAPAAVLSASDGSLRMEIRTTLPAIQLYGGQFLHSSPGGPVSDYASHAGVALEPQYLPDSPNHPEWPQPSCWLNPGEVSRHTIRYRFSTARASS